MSPSNRFDLESLSGYHPEIALLLATLLDSTREWREELGELSVDEVTWQPYEKGPSVATEIMHIAEVEAWWFEQVALGLPENVVEAKQLMSAEIQQYQGSWPTPPKEPLSYFIGLHDRVRQRTLESLKQFIDPTKFVPIRDGEFEMSLRWIVAHVIEHDSYHGGQAVLLAQLHKRVGVQPTVKD